MRRRSLITTSVALAAAAIAPAAAARADDWKPRPASYGISTQKNVPLTMRDGTVLRADVHTPTDPATGKPAAGPFPVILSETPYGKHWTGALEDFADYAPYLIRRGYIQAIVDVRGTGASQGTWDINQPAESADSAEAVRWAARLPRSNGRVGMHGISYGAMIQLHAAAAVGRGSPLKAIFPIFAGNSPYRDMVTAGGMLNLETVPAYIAVTSGLRALNPMLDGARDPGELLKVLVDHANGNLTFDARSVTDVLLEGERAFDGDYWQQRSARTVLDKVARNGVAAYLVAGLWDAFQAGQPLNFSGLQNAWAKRPVHAPMRARQRVTGRYQLLVGPWYHVLPGEGIDLDAIELRWFDRWLKREANGITRTRTPLHVIDAGGRRFEAARYPLPEAKPVTYYLHGGGALRTEAPVAGGSDRIVWTGASQPCNRVTEQWTLGLGELVFSGLGTKQPCTGAIQVPAGGPGTLSYTTPAFAEPTVLAGPIGATLHAVANTTETEWIATVSDVAPDGHVSELTQGALLGSFRAVDESRSWKAGGGRHLLAYHPYTRESQADVTPGKVTRYDIQIPPTFATLKPGHRLRLVITTADTPHLLPLPSRLTSLLGGVYDVQRNATAASSLQVPLAPAAALAP